MNVPSMHVTQGNVNFFHNPFTARARIATFLPSHDSSLLVKLARALSFSKCPMSDCNSFFLLPSADEVFRLFHPFFFVLVLFFLLGV